MAERADIDRAEVAEVLADVRGLWEDAQQLTGAAPPEDVQGVGTADEDRVQVTLLADGRVEDVRIHRKSMQSSEDLARFVLEAANRARTDLESKLVTEPGTSAAQHQAFAQRALALQKESAERLGRVIDGLAGNLDRIARAAGTNER